MSKLNKVYWIVFLDSRISKTGRILTIYHEAESYSVYTGNVRMPQQRGFVDCLQVFVGRSRSSETCTVTL